MIRGIVRKARGIVVIIRVVGPDNMKFVIRIFGDGRPGGIARGVTDIGRRAPRPPVITRVRMKNLVIVNRPIGIDDMDPARRIPDDFSGMGP